jgi:DNA adenine methylase
MKTDALLESGQNAPVTRPAFRWHGAKWKLAPQILRYFPAHRRYTESFGGGGALLLQKPRAYAEVYNDLDRSVVDVFTVLRDPVQAQELIRRLELTPFAREEFLAAYERADDLVEQVRRFLVRSLMGFGSASAASVYRTGFRANSDRSGTTPALDWRNYPGALPALVERLRGVVIENRDAAQVMAAHDGADTLHFVDPPYVHGTRSRRTNRRGVGVSAYNFELNDAEHAHLLEFLNTLEGMVVLCGYASALYEEGLAGWTRIEMPAFADGARPRTEILWLNPAASTAQPQRPLL